MPEANPQTNTTCILAFFSSALMAFYHLSVGLDGGPALCGRSLETLFDQHVPISSGKGHSVCLVRPISWNLIKVVSTYLDVTRWNTISFPHECRYLLAFD